MSTSGPFDLTLTGISQEIGRFSRRWTTYRQKPITREPNPYYNYIASTLTPNKSGDGFRQPEFYTPMFASSYVRNDDSASYYAIARQTVMDRAQAYAYGRFVDMFRGDSPELLLNWAQRREAFDMIAMRAISLRNAWNALRRGHPKKFFAALAVPNQKDPRLFGKKTHKQAASLWLEYHFGWDPLVQDICNAVDQAARPWNMDAVGKGYAAHSFSSDIDYLGTSSGWFGSLRGSCQFRLEAIVMVDNESLASANLLGLLDPIGTVRDAIPFSFVVDWFSNLSSWMSSYSDFFGFRLIRPRSTMKLQATSETYHYYTPPGGSRTVDDGPVSNDGFVFNRILGISPPALVLRIPDRLSIVRAVTAVSLLLQALR